MPPSMAEYTSFAMSTTEVASAPSGPKIVTESTAGALPSFSAVTAPVALALRPALANHLAHWVINDYLPILDWWIAIGAPPHPTLVHHGDKAPWTIHKGLNLGIPHNADGFQTYDSVKVGHETWPSDLARAYARSGPGGAPGHAQFRVAHSLTVHTGVQSQEALDADPCYRRSGGGSMGEFLSPVDPPEGMVSDWVNDIQ